VLSPVTEARLRARAEQIGQDVNDFAEALLLDGLVENITLSSDELAVIDAGIARGEADFAAGRFRSLDEVIADKKSRFGLTL
jgi:predicted transcriptional regulator